MDEAKGGGTVVVVHDDGDVVDLLSGLLRANGFQVEWCRSHDDAEQRLTKSHTDLVIAPGDRPIGKQIYRWATSKAPALRQRFVLVVDEIPRNLVRAAAQQRVARLTDLESVLYAVVTTQRRLRTRTPRATRPPSTKPPRPAARLLLVEDDPDQLAAMSEVLHCLGYDVVSASGVQAAELLLAAPSHIDAVLSDWCMSDGTGAELYHWIREHRPEFLGAVVFITGGDVAAARATVTPALVLPKGQDSRELNTALSHAIAMGRRTRPSTTDARRPRTRTLERPRERGQQRVLVASGGEVDTERQLRVRIPERQ